MAWKPCATAQPTGAHSGRVVRGRAWTGWPDGGCRAIGRRLDLEQVIRA